MLLSEIMAVENFMAFKKLMVKRNQKLNEEALTIMGAQDAGIDPNLVYQETYGQPNMAMEEDEIQRAIKASLELEKATSEGTAPPPMPEYNEEDEMLKKALEESKKEYEITKVAQKAEKEEVKAASKPK
jgi:hypothetical protein